MSGFTWWLRDSWEMVKRNLIHIKRTPELLLDVTISPIMFVLLFSFVFGGAINVGSEGGEDASYINFLMAGIFVQTVAFAGIYTGVLLANDLQKGMIDRFRSLPMSQSSVLTGRTLTDLMRAALAVAIMWIVGMLVGFRPEGGIVGNLAAVGLMLLFGFALSWVGVAAGALVRTPEAPAGHHIRRRLPADVRQQRVRPDGDHAGLDEGLCRTSADDPCRQRGARPDPRHRPVCGRATVGRLVRGNPDGGLSRRPVALQPTDHPVGQAGVAGSSTSRFSRRPMRSTSITTVCPTSMAATPWGVPVMIRSPGSSRVKRLMYSIR